MFACSVRRRRPGSTTRRATSSACTKTSADPLAALATLHNEGARRLQDRFDTRRLADRIAERLGREALTDDRSFITAQALFLLATADAEGRPECSYKGGQPGFVRVLDAAPLAFPS